MRAVGEVGSALAQGVRVIREMRFNLPRPGAHHEIPGRAPCDKEGRSIPQSVAVADGVDETLPARSAAEGHALASFPVANALATGGLVISGWVLCAMELPTATPMRLMPKSNASSVPDTALTTGVIFSSFVVSTLTDTYACPESAERVA